MSTTERAGSMRDGLLEELSEFLRMPSISAQAAEGDGGFRGCAEWVRESCAMTTDPLPGPTCLRMWFASP